MKKRFFFASASFVLAISVFYYCSQTEERGQVARSGDYEDLVQLFKDWREFQKPEIHGGVPDYTAAAMARQSRILVEYKNRLAAIKPDTWPISQQVDFHIIRAEMNGLDFDHRVLRPWSRNPCFYSVYYESPSDVPALEGPWRYGTLCLWKYTFPLMNKDVEEFRSHLQAIPRVLAQAKKNLVEEAADLWFLGIRVKKKESAFLGNLAQTLAELHPDLVPDVEQAREAVDDFQAWLEERQKKMTAASGIGVDNYNWYMKNVHLVPYSWEEQLVILERELHRAHACLKLEENRNRRLPPLELPASAEEYQARFDGAVDEFMTFLKEKEIMSVPDYLEGALERGRIRFVPPTGLRDFFIQVDLRNPMPLRCHGSHWFDLARMEHEPHPSPIRRVPLLYNIWDSRAEGLATGMEEMMMHAGLFDKRPRARELVYIMLANRAARAMGDLKMHSHEFNLEEAADFAVRWTPYGWLSKEGNTVWVDEQIYLEQPGYGTSYVVGKVHLEKLIADCSHQWREKFSLRRFMDEFHASGMIPLSLIRWEMTGLDDEIRKLW